MIFRHLSQILQTVNNLGVRKIIRLNRAKRWGWEGIIRGYFMTRAIQTLFNVGLLDAMLREESVDAMAYADKHDLDGRLLVALCDYLNARRILRKNGERFSLDSDGRFLVQTDLLRGWFQLTLGYEDVVHEMESLVRKRMGYGRGIVRNGEFVAVGSGLASADFYFPIALNIIKRAGYRKVLDLGCGDGTFLRFLCMYAPGVRGVGIDIAPDAIESGNKQLVGSGLEGRITLHHGDAFVIHKLKDELAGVDAATAFFVLHEFCDSAGSDGAVAFLRAYRETLPGVPLTIFESIRPDSDELRRRPGPGIEYFLFHDFSNQAPLEPGAWQKVFQRAGFSSVQEYYLSLARTSIFSVK